LNWPDDFINKIICGDCLEIMKEMPDESIDMVICSPPYWGLRDYGIEQIFEEDKNCNHEWANKSWKNQNASGGWQGGAKGGIPNEGERVADYKDRKIYYQSCLKCQAWKGQLGLEPTPEMYIEHLTEIFNEAKRVLKKEGTLWLNIGDTYWGGKGKSGYPLPHEEDERYRQGKTLQHGYQVPGYMETRPADGKHDFIQPKCLCMIPERLAWSLIQNGWILRNKNIWHKRNSMPSSVTDRFSNTYEFVYMFSKSQRYYFDLDAVREPHQAMDVALGTKGAFHNHDEDMIYGQRIKYKGKETYNPIGKNPGDVIEIKDERKGLKVPGQSPHGIHRKRHSGYFGADGEYLVNPAGKNPGDVFEIATQPFPEAHFAVFPEKLCEKPIKAGCPEEICKKCGKARERIVEVETDGSYQGERYKDRQDCKGTKIREVGGAYIAHSRHPADFFRDALSKTRKTIGWTTCNCNILTCIACGCIIDDKEAVKNAIQKSTKKKRIYKGKESTILLERPDKSQGKTEEIQGDLCGVQERIQGQKKPKDMQSKVFSEKAGDRRNSQQLEIEGRKASSMERGETEDGKRISLYPYTESSEGNKRRICNGASPCNGKTPEKIPREVGGCSSQKRDKKRQQNRESGIINSQNSQRKDSMSSLPEMVLDKITCPQCNSNKFKITHPGFDGGIVLDPFAGAGTALYVAKEMKRRYIGIDIKQEYCAMCEKRLAQGVL